MRNTVKSIKTNKLFAPVFFVGSVSRLDFGKNVKLYAPEYNGTLFPVIPCVLVYENRESKIVKQAVRDAVEAYITVYVDKTLTFEQRIHSVCNMLNIPIIYDNNQLYYSDLRAPLGMKLSESATTVTILAYLMSFSRGEVKIQLDSNCIILEYPAENDCRIEIDELADICSELGIRIEYSVTDIYRTVVYPFQQQILMTSDLKNPDNMVFDIE